MSQYRKSTGKNHCYNSPIDENP